MPRSDSSIFVIESPTSKWGGWNDDDDQPFTTTYDPTAFPTSFPTEDESESQFRAGYKKGEEVAQGIWEDNGSDCGYIFSFQDEVNDE